MATKTFNLELTLDELNFLTQLIGQLPTRTNSHDLYKSLVALLPAETTQNESDVQDTTKKGSAKKTV